MNQKYISSLSYNTTQVGIEILNYKSLTFSQRHNTFHGKAKQDNLEWVAASWKLERFHVDKGRLGDSEMGLIKANVRTFACNVLWPPHSQTHVFYEKESTKEKKKKQKAENKAGNTPENAGRKWSVVTRQTSELLKLLSLLLTLRSADIVSSKMKLLPVSCTCKMPSASMYRIVLHLKA